MFDVTYFYDDKSVDIVNKTKIRSTSSHVHVCTDVVHSMKKKTSMKVGGLSEDSRIIITKERFFFKDDIVACAKEFI